MKKTVLFFVVILSLAYIAGCSGPAQSAAVPETTPVPSPEVQTSATAPGPNESAPGLEASEDPYWEVDSLEAFDELMSNADGYAYYYIFEKVPDDLKFAEVGIKLNMDHYAITFLNSKNERVLFYVFTIPEDYKGNTGKFNEMELDGTTYYWSEEYYEGELLVSYFQWEQDNKIFLIHPKEPITEDVIRKYNKLTKVEFNKGKEKVGMDTNIALISDIEKITELVRSNPEIHFHTGIVNRGYEDDLLR